ncbi:MAG TPA: helix-turn-helix transcriptional regulator [Vicinamibacterales bacterium]|nr:helix-turn-helix transcriptional regulator [Vicinamibacterales bacterium]
MHEKFGARSRQRREAQGIDLHAVTRQTKIKLSLLEALEQDDVSAWPGGLFRRAFVRAYAEAIGLDPDGAVREFLADFPDSAAVVGPWAEPDHRTGPVSGPPPTRLHTMVGSAISSLSRIRRTEAPPVAIEPPSPPPLRVAFDPPPVPVAIDPPAPPAPLERPRETPDLLALACLCTELGRVARAEDLPPLLEECAKVVEAKGVIVWVWDDAAAELRPALGHGYSDGMLARLPVVTRDSDNATAEAFRTARTCIINGNGASSGALVLPLLTPAGCSGVLAIEFEGGAEQTPGARAVSTIVAAMLAQLVAGETAADSADRARSRESA